MTDHHADRRPRRLTLALHGVVELLLDAASSLLLRPGHTIGMIAGITLGIAGSVGVIVVSDTQQAQIDRQFDLQRSDHVAIRALAPNKAGFDEGQRSVIADLEPVEQVGEFSIWSPSQVVSRADGSAANTRPIVVADSGGLAATESRITAGDQDLARATGAVAWIGETLADDLGIEPEQVTSASQPTIKVGRQSFRVVGLVANNSGYEYLSSGVVVSRRTAVSLFDGLGDNIRTIAHVRPGSAESVGTYMMAALDPARALLLEDVTPPDGEILLGKVNNDLRRIGAALAVFMGLIGTITVANTLIVSVYQRRREIGLRSAMGWSRRRISLLVLTESGIAGLLSGIIGVGLGLLAALAWSLFQDWTLILATWLPFAAIGAGLLASIIGGLIPAYRAGSTSPMTAMRS